MFRCAISTASRTVASSSQANAFHTSSVTLSKASQRISARNKKKNISRTAERLKEEALNQPSFVLGTRTAEEGEKWVNCKLSQVLVTEEQLVSTAETVTQRFSIGEVELPKEFGHGVTETEKTILFQDLPVATMNMTSHVSPDVGVVERAEVRTEETRELTKANLVAKALDLRNANAAGIAFENRRRIIEAFSTPANPFDPGRTEVQVALLTYKIRNLWKHLTNFKRDVGNRRSLRKLVHQRASLLKYLKRSNRDRYDIVLEQLALEPEAVEGELVI